MIARLPGRRKLLLGSVAAMLVLFVLVLMLPSRPAIPVAGATPADWNHESFWYHPWGPSGVHKGIDIFADTGTPVLAATAGVVLFAGELELGGKVVAVLGSRWRIHYYAHLDSIAARTGAWVRQGEEIGTVGTTGNAAGKAAHLHYVILTAVPYPWRITRGPQGWKRAIYLDPHEQLT